VITNKIDFDNLFRIKRLSRRFGKENFRNN